MKAGSDFFQIAKAGAEQFRDAAVGPARVVVERTLLGPAVYPHCDGDVFERGILTITSQETGGVMHNFWPGQWTEATAYGSDGHVRYCLLASEQKES